MNIGPKYQCTPKGSSSRIARTVVFWKGTWLVVRASTSRSANVHSYYFAVVLLDISHPSSGFEARSSLVSRTYGSMGCLQKTDTPY